VKEFAFFIRDGRFSKIDTAAAHYSAVRQQMGICHALTRREIFCYSQLHKGHIEHLVQEMRFGIDAVLQASERVSALIASIEADPTAQLKSSKGFQILQSPTGKARNVINAEDLLARCNLPDSAKLLPRVSWLIADAARRNGLSLHKPSRLQDEFPELVNVTEQTLQRWLDCLDVLFAIRHHAECKVPSFRPFE